MTKRIELPNEFEARLLLADWLEHPVRLQMLIDSAAEYVETNQHICGRGKKVVRLLSAFATVARAEWRNPCDRSPSGVSVFYGRP